MIYLDNAATTKTAPEVLQAMLPYFSELYGNPSSIYQLGAKNKAALTESREKIAKLINCRTDEIYFTSGGSEADNWTIKSVFEAFRDKGNHIITTKIEHPAVLRTCEYLEREYGAEVTYLDVDKEGFVRPEDVEDAIRPDTILISVMTANNEIGTIEPIREIGAIAHAHGVLFHTDAVQAFGQVPLDVERDNIDFLSASGHKLNGPKGTGCLYIRNGIPIRSFIHGGAQEHNRRAGTENVPGIVGFGTAAEIAGSKMRERILRETKLRNYLIGRLMNEIPEIRLNGPEPPAENLIDAGDREGLRRLPNNVNVSIEFTEGESVLIMLDMQGICASSGSACSSGSLDPSHVLQAIGLSDSLAHGALRLTLSYETTKEELDQTVDAIGKIAERLRKMSPAYKLYYEGKAVSEVTGEYCK